MNHLLRNILFFATILMMSSCDSRFEGSRIDAEIANAEGRLLLMEDIATPDKVIVDSAVVTDGKASFKLYTNEGIYRLRDAASNQMVFLYVDGKSGRQELKWDLLEPEAYTVTGSRESEDLRRIVLYASKSAKEYALLDSVQKSGTTDLEITAQAISLNRSLLKDFVTKMVDSLPNADVAAFALNYADMKPENLPYLVATTEKLKAKDDRARYAALWYETFNAYRNGLLSNIEYGFQVGTKAPDFALPHRLGDTLRLSDFKGKFVLLDFWASWCQPCRKENPNLVEAYRSFRKRNFTIVSISLDSKKEQWENGIETDKLMWRNHASDLRKWRSPVVTTYDLKAIPANYILDSNGVIVGKDLKGEALLAFLDALLPPEVKKDSLPKDSIPPQAIVNTSTPAAPVSAPASSAPATAAPVAKPPTPAATPRPAQPSKPAPAPTEEESTTDPANPF
jgi:peroxiredoxin